MKQDSKSRKKPTKATKKPAKIVNRNYFARGCRFLGRILLFAGIIACIGTASVLILQSFQPNKTSEPASVPVSTTPTNPASTTPTSVAFNIIITLVIILCAIVALIYLAYKYNNYARSFINWISTKTKLPIHCVELIMPLLFWTTTVVMLIPTFPVATIPIIFTLILNEFLFILAWLAYGCPFYEK